MPSVRHFVALGVGAAIALNGIEPSSSKDVPSITQPQPYGVKSQNTQLEVVPSQGYLTASSQDSPEIDPKETQEESISVNELLLPNWIRNETEYFDNQFGVSATLNEQVERDREVLQQAAHTEDEENIANNPSTKTSQDNVEQIIIQSPASATSQDQQVERDREVWRQAAHTEDEENIANNPSTETSQDNVEQIIVQSQASETSQSPATTPGSAPEFLNPSVNPLLFPTEAEEVQVQTTQPITLQQALELAQRNNRDLTEARLTLERSRSQLREALADQYPSATFNADFTRSDSAQGELSNQSQDDNPFFTNDDDTISTSFNGSLELSYDLYTAGRRSANIRAAEEQVRFQQLDLERIFEQLRLDITNTYYDLQEADAQVEISQAAVTDAARSLRDAQLQEQAGLGTRFDVLQAQVQLANENQGLIRAVSQQRIRRRQLTRLLSLAQPVEVSAADPIEVAGDWELSLEQSIILALKNRAELEQELASRNINQQQRRIALAATRPQANIFAGYDILGILDDDFGPADGFTLGARLQWNFFDGGAARARARTEETEIEISENRFADQRNQVRLEVEQAFFELSANEENIQTASFALEQAQESLRLSRLRFQAGVGTQAEVITQQTELTRARVNRLTAILDYNRALAALQRAISNLPDSNLFDLP